MPIKFVTATPNVPVEIVAPGPRDSVLISNPHDGTGTLWVEIPGDAQFHDVTPDDDTDNFVADDFAVGVGVPCRPGQQKRLSGAKITLSLRGISDETVTVGVSEFHNPGSIEII